MSLTVLLTIEIVFYSVFALFLVKAAGKIDPSLSAFIYNGIASVVPLCIYLYYKSKNAALISPTQAGLTYSVIAGGALVICAILLVRIFEKGGASYAIPLIYGGTIFLSTLSGWLLFKENVTPLHLAGAVVTLIGIGMIACARMRGTG